MESPIANLFVLRTFIFIRCMANNVRQVNS
jgi:hypothetical protein